MRLVPDNVLLPIFDAVACDDPLPWPNASYDQERACQPFVLAAVCQHWRHLARNTSRLWTYFGFLSEPPGETRDAHLERLHLLRSLSKDHPVDVVFHCALYGRNPNNHEYRSEIFTALNDLGHRWRSVALKLPYAHIFEIIGAMNGYSPFLHSLSIWFNHDLEAIPQAPRLERAYLEYDELKIDATALYLPSLTSLAVFSDDHACRLFNPTCARLRSLCILEMLQHIPGAPCTFPCLRSLTLRDASFLHLVHAPKLKTMNLCCKDLDEGHTSALSRFQELEHLGLFGEIWAANTAALSMLSSIRSLSIGAPLIVRWAMNEDSTMIWTGMFAKLAEAVPPVWPTLERICLGNFGFRGHGTESQDQFLAFIRNRESGVVTVPSSTSPKRVHIEIDPQLSDSLRQRVQAQIQSAVS
ncbi:hypothetical protein BKA62DRAFT_724250 [Auriculariales sp. MPI-PUGE-AT-0066]|nr:hypothetical protein BKA62DRAFT_724250 [Auriculariales sp. MPI-PUGE-AT-0066]